MAKITGLDQMRRRIRELQEAPKREMERELDRQSDRLVSLSKALAPEESGDLKASIQKTPGRHELERRVVAGGEKTTREVRKGSGEDFDYSAKVEFTEQPFLFPAARALRRSINGALGRSYRRAAKLTGGNK